MKLPDFPWDALAPFGQRARLHPHGAIDLSQGTPVDPTPEFIQSALAENSNSPSYPVTTGSPDLRAALKAYCASYLGAEGDFDVLPTIGSKELVAQLPFLLQAKKILIPEIAYPTYRVGGILAGADVAEVGIDATTWSTSGIDMAWVNSPSNPTGRVHSPKELEAVLEWSRISGAVIASDECYLPFPDKEQGISILSLTSGHNTNVLAVHSLSKRSNMAGYRGAFVAGDPILISQLLEIRKHMGMMVPLPIQKAVSIAVTDESHVVEQAERYRARRRILSDVLKKTGFTIEHSDAGLYLWCTRNESDWSTVEWFADRGIIVTPGRFYGEKGNRHVRIALTATDAQISDAAERIGSSL
ncbi:MAG: succinyldiaminopimelate transaminase, partial [Actinomycetota bacterium]